MTPRSAHVGTLKTDSPFGRLLRETPEALQRPKVGDVVKGTILEIAPNSLYVDLGAQGVGIVFGRELLDAADTFRTAKVGDPAEAVVFETENDAGYIELSLRSVSEERGWSDLEAKLKSGEIFPTQILSANKGGLIVRVAGMTGFLPVSQLSAEHYPRVEGGDKQKILERLQQYIGQDFNTRVITADRGEGKLIVSEKAAMTPEMKAALAQLQEGTEIEGIISGIVDFGTFVKFHVRDQELEGLVHISELAWQRVDDPSDYVRVGQQVRAVVLGADGARISLSLKRLRKDPWLTVEEKYAVGQQVEGEILKLTPFGAFVKLDEDIHGLAHVSELSDKEGVRPTDLLKVGEQKPFRIISIEPEEHRLGLSLKPDAKPKETKEKRAAGARRPTSSRQPAGRRGAGQAAGSNDQRQTKESGTTKREEKA